MVNGRCRRHGAEVELFNDDPRVHEHAASLAREIGAEEERSRIRDPAHVALLHLAKALAIRRGKLLISALSGDEASRSPV